MEGEQFSWVQEYDGDCFSSRPKRKYQARKREFCGWGSRDLIAFLKSIGRDTSIEVSQYDVSQIITKYIDDNHLTVPGKKKRFQCDERLQALFGKKTLGKNKIYASLGEHYAENNEDSGEEFLWSSDDKEDEDVLGRNERTATKPAPKKTVVQTPKSPFVAIIPDNIKLIYLKRSLVEDLFKDPANFEGKFVGSFIRIKSDPNDYTQKNPYRLVQVTGVKIASANKCADVSLKFAGSFKDIRVSLISDDNFTKEECADLCQRVKDGLLQQPLIVEFEKKVKILHEDITKHWLARELALLQNLIDRANEKGWRKEFVKANLKDMNSKAIKNLEKSSIENATDDTFNRLSEYLERRQLLQSPAEQSRLLQEVPNVIADEIEVTSVETDIPKSDAVKDTSPSPRSILKGNINATAADTLSDGEMKGDVIVAKGPQLTPIRWKKDNDDYWHATEIRELQKTQVTKEMQNEQTPLTSVVNETSKEKVEIKFQAPQMIDFMRTGPRPFTAKVNEGNQQKVETKNLGLPVIDVILGLPVIDIMQNGQRTVEMKERNEKKVEMTVRAKVNEGNQQKVETKTPGLPVISIMQNGQRTVEVEESNKEKVEIKVQAPQVIDLSSDDEIEHPSSEAQSCDYDTESSLWHYLDPQDDVQGPFSLERLKIWSDEGYFDPDFKVWKVGQSPNEAVLLMSILHQINTR